MKKKASKKNRITAILLVAVLLAGLSLLLYPLVSNYWNSIHQSQEGLMKSSSSISMKFSMALSVAIFLFMVLG